MWYNFGMKTKTNFNTYFFFAILAVLTVLGFFIVKPFIIPFVFALILAHFFAPVYRNILKKIGSKGLSSFLVCILVALIIIIPVIVILIVVVGEVQTLVVSLSNDPEPLRRMVDFSHRTLSSLPFIQPAEIDKLFSQSALLSAAKNFSQWSLSALQGATAGVSNFVFVMFIMFFSLFYMLIDGEKLAKKVMKIFPLQDKYDKLLLNDLNSIIRATIKGTIILAVLQGIIGAILFVATGVASPIFFGVLMMVASVVPSLGSGLVWLPVGVIMILLGYPVKGIIILLVGGLVISTIDNLLRPKLVGQDTQMHPLLILFSTLGGIALFGLSGFIVGPIAVSIIVALWDIYLLEFKA